MRRNRDKCPLSLIRWYHTPDRKERWRSVQVEFVRPVAADLISTRAVHHTPTR